jgi:uncharacterized membrane protein
VTPIALAFIAVSAVLHASWNILLKGAGDPLRTATIGMVAASFLLVPGALAAWVITGAAPVPAEALLLGFVSGLVEIAYFIFLAAAYRRGDLSVVAPLARGSAPLLLVAVGVLLLGEHLAPLAAVGVALLLAGLLTVQRPWRFLRGTHAASRSAAGFALLTGLTIAMYSTIDRVGVRLMAPWLYAAILWPVCAVGLLGVGWLRPRIAGGAFAPTATALDLGRAIIGGLLTLGAYLLMLAALSVTPLAIVSPLRESAMLLTSTWGVIRLGEAAGRREIGLRLTGSVMVLAGVLLLAIGG